MAPFNRTFDLPRLEKHVETYPRGVVAALLDRWVLPGESSGRHGLRLAIRNGSINFYACGQSVAELVHGRDGLMAEMAVKYVDTERSLGNLTSKGNVRFGDRALGQMNGEKAVSEWTRRAILFASDEKKFVDELIAANPNTIDVEMALPGDKRVLNREGKIAAPRIDLVVCDTVDGISTISFWEAKLAVNPSIRSESRPEVLDQLETYTRWMRLSDRRREVSKAYRSAAGLMASLAKRFDKDETSVAFKTWERVQQGDPCVFKTPGLVVSNYTPGLTVGTMDMNSAKAYSFHEHANKIRRAGITLVEVKSSSDLASRLPARAYDSH